MDRLLGPAMVYEPSHRRSHRSQKHPSDPGSAEGGFTLGGSQIFWIPIIWIGTLIRMAAGRPPRRPTQALGNIQTSGMLEMHLCNSAWTPQRFVDSGYTYNDEDLPSAQCSMCGACLDSVEHRTFFCAAAQDELVRSYRK